MNREEFLKFATVSCQNRLVLDWYIDDSAIRVVRLGNDDLLVISYGPSEGGLLIDSTIHMNEKECCNYFADELLVDIFNPALKLFFERRI
jgi:hypothetical protein